MDQMEFLPSDSCLASRRWFGLQRTADVCPVERLGEHPIEIIDEVHARGAASPEAKTDKKVEQGSRCRARGARAASRTARPSRWCDAATCRPSHRPLTTASSDRRDKYRRSSSSPEMRLSRSFPLRSSSPALGIMMAASDAR